jgi:hypothetical protein
MEKHETMHLIQSMICKYLILHSEDTQKNLDDQDLKSLATFLYKTV